MTNRTIANLRRRLALAELDLLRDVCADQAAQIEALSAELARAVDTSDQWRKNFMNLQDQILEDQPAYQPGITQSGAMGIVKAN